MGKILGIGDNWTPPVGPPYQYKIGTSKDSVLNKGETSILQTYYYYLNCPNLRTSHKHVWTV